MNRLLIIDGHNLHFQIFFGIRAKQKKRSGRSAQFGESFAGAIKRIIRIAAPTHVIVIFDGEHENPRRALFPAYKANRPDYDLLPDEENPYLKLPDALAALDRMGIKYIETTTVEADDLIALCCESFKSAAEIVVCSHDHDFYQLIGPRVKIMSYSGKQGTYYGESNFREEFHISPRRFADYKALTGDKSDNIPGVRGVGNITAARLINRCGGVEDIIARTGEVRQKKLRRCLIEGVDRMRLNYKLVKLGGEQYGDIELPWSFSELAFALKDDPKKRGKEQKFEPNQKHLEQKPKQRRKPRLQQKPLQNSDTQLENSETSSKLESEITALPETQKVEPEAQISSDAHEQKNTKKRRPRRKKRPNNSADKSQHTESSQVAKQETAPNENIEPMHESVSIRKADSEQKSEKIEQKPERDKNPAAEKSGSDRSAKRPQNSKRRGNRPRKNQNRPANDQQGNRIQTRKEAWND